MADQANGINGDASDHKARHRSPNYPGVSLKMAIEKVTKWYKQDGWVSSPRDAALAHMGFEKFSGDAGRLLSALKSFGLVQETDGRLRLTQRSVDIVAREDGDAKKTAALKDAATGPQIYRDLLKEYPNGLPSDGTLKSELIAGKKFNPKSVGEFVKDFRATLTIAGISHGTVLESHHEQKSNTKTPVLPKTGDFIQWESSGVLQFPEPKRVRGLSPDNEWVFVEDSETGISVKEITVVDTPETEKPEVKPSAPPTLPLNPPRIYRMDQLTSQGRAEKREDVFSLAEGTVTIQWPAMLSPESYEDLSAWLDILKRKIGRSINDRRQAQKNRITKAVHKLHSNAVVKFEDHGLFIWFRVLAPDGTTLLLPYSEDREPEFYERLSEEELEERLHALSNNRL